MRKAGNLHIRDTASTTYDYRRQTFAVVINLSCLVSGTTGLTCFPLPHHPVPVACPFARTLRMRTLKSSRARSNVDPGLRCLAQGGRRQLAAHSTDHAHAPNVCDFLLRAPRQMPIAAQHVHSRAQYVARRPLNASAVLAAKNTAMLRDMPCAPCSQQQRGRTFRGRGESSTPAGVATTLALVQELPVDDH